MNLNKVKRFIPKDPVRAGRFYIKGGPEEVRSRVETWMRDHAVARDRDGRRILIANPENGSLRNRAWHLIAGKQRDSRGQRVIYKPDKARMVGDILNALADPALIVEQGHPHNSRIYLRRYEDGRLHAVFVDPQHRLSDHGEVDAALLTQFAPENRYQFTGAKVVAVRRNSAARGQAGAGSSTVPRRPSAPSTESDPRDAGGEDPTTRLQEVNTYLDGAGVSEYPRVLRASA